MPGLGRDSKLGSNPDLRASDSASFITLQRAQALALVRNQVEGLVGVEWASGLDVQTSPIRAAICIRAQAVLSSPAALSSLARSLGGAGDQVRGGAEK